MEWCKSLPQNRIKKKEWKGNEDNLRDLWDNIKCTNIHIIGVPEGEEKEKGPEKIFEDITAENFPNMGKETLAQIQEAHSPIQDEPKEEHAKIHINLTDKN